MSNDIKKQRVKKLLDSIQEAANQLIDIGTETEPSTLVMSLAMSAYELDLMQEAADKFSSLKGTTDNQTEIIEFKPKDMQ
jgi:cytochrome c553